MPRLLFFYGLKWLMQDYPDAEYNNHLIGYYPSVLFATSPPGAVLVYRKRLIYQFQGLHALQHQRYPALCNNKTVD